ncbi:MAG: phosphoglycerate kinase [Gemmatimonadetes bacterium]|nr:phosphoglycerate kinase [Gemmatimonadota bacterium]
MPSVASSGTHRRSLRDLAAGDLAGRRALVRVDFNVPLGGDPPQVRDPARIRAALPTIEHLRAAGARVVLMSHLGRPKGRPDPALSLRPVGRELEALIGADVGFVDDPLAAAAVDEVARLQPGGILLLENLRFWPGETDADPAFAAALARLGDLFVQDAFGTLHRAHASTSAVPAVLRPAVAGLLLAAEFEAFARLREEPARPYVAILGGAKISGKLETLRAILEHADRVLVGGGMASTFYLARGWEVGGSLVEHELVQVAAELLDAHGAERLEIAMDAVVAHDVRHPASPRVVAAAAMAPDTSVGDIGPRSRAAFARRIDEAATVFWNGPMGIFESPAFAEGTLAVARAVARATERGAYTVVGGGDSVAALAQMGLQGSVSHVSTGGGAGLELLAGRVLPGLAALESA